MKIVKKFCLVLSVILLLSVLVSCGKEAKSGVSISDVSQKLSSGKWSFTDIKESGEKREFTYSEDYFLVTITYSGIADRKDNVSLLKITTENLDTLLLTNSSKLNDVVTKTLNNSLGLTLAEASAAKCVVDFLNLRELLDPAVESAGASVSEIASFFGGKTILAGKWEIKANINATAETVVITATYNG